MNPAAVLSVMVKASGIEQTNAKLATVDGTLAKTGGNAGKTGELLKKGLLVGATGAVAVGTALFKVGKSFDDAYDTIRVGTGKTGAALEGLKGDFKAVVKGVPTDFGTASKAITEVNQRLGLTGKPLQAVSKQFLELSRITKTDVSTNIQTVTRAFGDWEVKTKDQAGTLDKFFRAAQASGSTVDKLAAQVTQFGAPLRQVGFSLDEATAMFAAFEKAGVNTSTMMPGIKMALKSFLAEGLDPKKELAATFKGIKDGSIDTSAALKIFGARAGPDMVEAIKQGRFSLDSMTKTLVNGSDTIRKAGKDTMDFGEKWTMFKNKVLVAIEPIAIRVFDAVGKAMEVIPPIAAKVIAVVAKIVAPFVAVAKAVLGNKTAVLALAAASAVLLTAWAGFKIVGIVVGAVRGLVTVFWLLNAAMYANPIGLIVLGLAALAAAIVVAWRNSDTFRAVLTTAFSAVSAAFGWLLTAAKDVFGWLRDNWPLVLAIIAGPIGLAAYAIYSYWEQIKGAATTAWNFIKTAASATWDAIKTVIVTPIRLARDVLVTVWAAISTAASTAWAALKAAAGIAWEALKSVILTPIRAARDALGEILNSIRSKLTEAWEAVKGTASKAWNAVETSITGAVSGAYRTVTGKIKDFIQIGEDIVRGIATGIKNAASSVIEAIGGAVKGAINKAKGMLGIKSPSKVFAGFGRMVSQGMANGILADAGKVTRAMEAITQAPALAGVPVSYPTGASAPAGTMPASASAGAGEQGVLAAASDRLASRLDALLRSGVSVVTLTDHVGRTLGDESYKRSLTAGSPGETAKYGG